METRVASVHFFPVEAKRLYRGNPYTIPAVKFEAPPVIITTRDLYQNDEGPYLTGTNKRQKLQYLVKGEEIARCIVGSWTGTTVHGPGMNPNCHPGIWVVRETMPVIETEQKTIGGEQLTHEEKMVVDAAGNQVFRPASRDEREEMWDMDLAHARAADRAYAEWCWNEGNRINQAWQHGSKEPVPREMPVMYKAAARHYGLDAAWLKEAASSNSHACPYCETLVSKTAIVCPVCVQPIDLEKWARLQSAKEAALAAHSEGPKRKPLPPPVTISSQSHAGA